MKKFEITLRKATIGKQYEEFIIVGVENNNIIVIDTDEDEQAKYAISPMNKIENDVVWFRTAGSSKTAQSIGERLVVEFDAEDKDVEAKEKEIFAEIK
jgi:hypothetical protein